MKIINEYGWISYVSKAIIQAAFCTGHHFDIDGRIDIFYCSIRKEQFEVKKSDKTNQT